MLLEREREREGERKELSPVHQKHAEIPLLEMTLDSRGSVLVVKIDHGNPSTFAVGLVLENLNVVRRLARTAHVHQLLHVVI